MKSLIRASIVVAGLCTAWVTIGSAVHVDTSAGGGTIRPGRLWYDTAGHVINAHGGGIMYHEGTYWWYGEHKVYGRQGNRAHVGIHVYSSTDLVTWRDRGIALPVADAPLRQGMSTSEKPPDSDICDGCVMERPKVIFCPKTGKFSMFFHLELKGQGYRAARTGIAVADKPEGPFKFLRSFRPNGQMSRDMTLFVDNDGKAYHIFASEENKTAHVDELTDDFLDYTGKSVRIMIDESTEGIGICRHGGKYWLIGSGCTGWAPNTARLYVADRITGPYKRLGNPCRGTNPINNTGPELTWGGQSTFLLAIHGTDRVIAMFDIWNPKNHEESRYVWLPVDFSGEMPTISWLDEWKP